MKSLFILSLNLLFSAIGIAFQTRTPGPGIVKIEAYKSNAVEKKVSKDTTSRKQVIGNQKTKKKIIADNKEFYGLLSWKPALLY